MSSNAKCATRFCRNRTRPSGHSRYCRKCRWRALKASDPLRYSFYKLKDRARERGKDFSLTFTKYEKFARESGYAELKGKTAASLSIDRVDNAQGYHAWNIRALTLSANTRRQYANLPDYVRAEMEQAELASKRAEAEAVNCPF